MKDAPPMKTDVPVHEPDGTIADLQRAGAPAPAQQPPAPSVDPLDSAVDAATGDAQVTQHASDPLDAAVGGVVQDQSHKAEQDKNFAAYLATHQDTAPEKRLDAIKYAIAADMDPSAVEGHLDELKKTVDAKALAQRLQAAPGLAKFMLDATKAPVAKDDAANLSAMEWGLTGHWENGHLVTAPAPLRALSDALRQQDYISLANKQAEGRELSQDEQKQLQELETKYGGEKDYGAQHWWSKAYLGLFKMAPYLSGDIVSRAAGGFTGAVAGAASGAGAGAAAGAPAAGVGAVPGAAVGTAAGAVAGAGAGQAVGSTVWNFFQNFGPQYRQLKRLTDTEGKPLLSDNEARAYAGTASLVAAGLMTGASGVVLKKLPGVQSLLGKLGADAVSKALTQSTVRSTLAMAPVKLGATAVAGGLMMAGQAAANAGSEELAKATHGQEANFGHVSDAAQQAFVQGVQDMAFLSAFGAGHEFLQDMGRARLLQEHTQRFQAESEAAEQSSLLKRSPELFEQAHRLAQGENTQARYIGREEWDRYWQQKAVDPGQMAARVLGDGGRAYAEAHVAGGDLAIPAEKFMSAFANTEHLAGLRPDVRFTQDGVSLNQARAALESTAKDAASPPAEADSAEQVRQEWARKAVEAGEDPQVADATGALVGAAFRNLGSHMGMDAMSAYRELSSVRIVRGEGAPAEDSGFEFGSNVTPSGLEEAKAAAQRMAPENRQAALDFIDYATGQREDRPAIPADLEKKLATFGVVDPKGFGFAENGRSLERPVTTQKVRGQEPEELRRIRELNREHKEGRYSQGPALPAATQHLLEHSADADHQAMAEDIYRDHATGLLNETAFHELPPPEGKQLAVFETGNVKNVNDHPLYGGHEIADAPLRALGKALAEAHGGDVFFVRGGFRAYVKDAAEAKRLRETVNAKLADKDFPLLSSVGKTPDEAFKALDKVKEEQRAKGAFPKREGMTPDFERRLPSLAFPEDKAAPKLPEALVEKVKGLTPREAFHKAYVEPETGLLTAKGWNLIPRKKFVVAIDLRGLKAINDDHGKAVGDLFLRHFGQQATGAGGSDFDFAHRSGDEYLAQSDDKEALVRHIDELRQALKDTPLTYTSPSGEVSDIVVQFRHGIGDGEHAEVTADRSLNQQRADEKAGKARPDGRGAAEGSGGEGRAPRGEGRQTGERSGRPQGFPEEVAANRLFQPAWHGSPHDFEQFSLHKIGTGEGAQAYGWGLYFAGSKEVAEHYRGKLAVPEVTIRGKESDALTPAEMGIRNAIRDELQNRGGTLEKVVARLGSELQGDIKHWQHRIQTTESFAADLEHVLASSTDLKPTTRNRTETRIAANRDEAANAKRHLQEAQAKLETLKSLGPDDIDLKAGQVFHVDIPGDDELLDYDKKMTEQPKGVLEKLDAVNIKKHLARAEEVDYSSPEGKAYVDDWFRNMTGAELYRVLARSHDMYYRERYGRPLGSGGESAEAAASYTLRNAGIPGLRYLDGNSRSVGDGSHNYVIWKDDSIKVLAKLYQGERLGEAPEGGEFRLDAKGRGFIEFRPPEGGEARRFDIHLLAGADQSTLAHETFHFLGEVLGDVATRPDAPEQVRQDYQTLLSYMGHASHEERQASAAERRQLSAKTDRTAAEDTRLKELTAKEEKATHAWEQYLAEGKPPSAELAGAFTRFRRWLKDIYRGIQGVGRQFAADYGQELNLSDDVRKVFDRLLASDEEIRRAEAANVAAQPFPKVLDGMTPEERMSYMKATVDAREAAQDELLRRIVAAQRKENTAFMRGERERTRAQVEKEMDAQPAYRALRFLQDGDTPESPGETPWLLKGPDGERLRLDRQDVTKVMGKDFSQALPRGVFAPKGKGISADELAARLGGWEDGRAMLQALAATTPRARAIAEETQRRLEAQYGPDLLDNPQKLAELAMDAVHNEAQARKAFLELEAIRKQLKGSAPPADALTPELARQTAQRLVGEKSVGELLAGEQGLAGRYLRAERTAAKRALEAMESGNLQRAYAEKQTQILNQALYREASRLRASLEKVQAKVEDSDAPTWRAALGKASPLLRDAHDAILQAIGIRRAEPGAPKPSIEGAVQLATADGQPPAFDVDAVRELLANPRPFGSLTPDEALNVRDAVVNLKHMANQRNEVVLDGKVQAKEALFAEMAEAIGKRPAQPARARDAALESKMEDVRRILQMLDAQLLTPDSLIQMMDGGEKDGPFRRALMQPLHEARLAKRKLVREFVGKVVKAWEELPAELRKGKSEVIDLTKDLPLPPDLQQTIGDGPVTRSYLWMLALNMGNEGNKQRLLDGYGWTEAQVLKALDKHMSKAEWDFVQKTWDTLEGLYPHIADVHEKATGLRPPKVVATPVETKWGTYAGGYFPAREEPRAKTGPVHHNVESIADMFGEAYRRPAVATGHAKARVEKADYYVNLNWGVVPSHISQVVHDVAYRDVIRQTAGLILDPRFRDLSDQYLGAERGKQMVPWLQAVANQQADSVPANVAGANRVLGWVRGRQLRMALGGNLASLAKHWFDPAIGAVGGVTNYGDTALAYAKGVTGVGFASMRKFALENSEELPGRADKVTRELERQLKEIGDARPGAVLRGLKATAHGAYEVMGVLHDAMDRFVTTLTWNAAYTGEYRAANNGDGMTADAAHARAVKAADEAVRKVYPSEDIAQQALIIRRKDFLGTTMAAFSFANKVWNLRRQLGDSAWLAVHDSEATFTSKAGAVAKVAGAFLVGLPLIGLATQYLSGRRPDDDETKEDFAARTLLADNFSDTPLAGPVAESLARLAVTGKAKKPEFHDQPAVTLINELWTKVQAAKASGDLTEEQKLERQLETVLSLAFAGSGATQLHRSLDYGRQLYTGEAQPRGPADVLGGLIYGRSQKKPSNPLTDVQGAISE